MNKQFNFSFIFLLFIAIISSCTLEKRLYRSGYHFELRKTKVTHSSEQAFADYSTNEKTKKSTDSDVTEIDVNNRVSPSEINNYTINSVDVQPEKYVCPTEIKFIQNNISRIENEMEDKQEKDSGRDNLSKNAVKKFESPFKKDDSTEDRVRGIYLLLIALALFGLGYLFYSFIGAIGLVFFWIFGISAGICFLFGLIYIIWG